MRNYADLAYLNRVADYKNVKKTQYFPQSAE